MTTLLVQRLVVPPRATAQVDQPQEVRASAFVLVGPDGTVLGRWEARPANPARGSSGGGKLTIFSAAGTQRAALDPNGLIVVYDPTDGTTPRFVAGYSTATGPTGNPPFSGIQLDPQGAITVLPPPTSP